MRCHYEVLEVQRTATADEIKKSYRKIALRLHPDKNPDNVEECTQLFAEVQSAYEVLSDPQERAWYDSHRDAILRGGSGGGDHGLDLMQYFTASCYSGYGDGEDEFYGVYSRVFATIAREDKEYLERVDDHAYPPFGKSTSDYNPTVSEFYSWWQAYSTPQSFAWADKYDERDAPNRQIRRLIEKENKKAREAEKKKHNDEVKQLVEFVRKRDKRVKVYLEQQKEREKKQAEEKQVQLLARKLEESKRKKQLMEEYQEQHWTNVDAGFDMVESHVDDEFGADSQEEYVSGSDVEVEGFYCPACNRAFRTQNTWDNHLVSRKHQEKVEALRAEMEDEEAELDGSNAVSEVNSETEEIDADEVSEKVKKGNTQEQLIRQEDTKEGEDKQEGEEGEGEGEEEEDRKSKKEKQKKRSKQKKPMFGYEHEVVSENESDARVPTPSLDPPEKDSEGPSGGESSAVPTPKLKGKKAKEARKAAKAAQQPAGETPREAIDDDLQCHICREVFQTRNKLFQHIQRTGHAELKTVTGGSVGGQRQDSDDDWDVGKKKKGKGRKK